MYGYNSRTSLLGQGHKRSKGRNRYLRITPFQILVKSREIVARLFSSLNVSKYDYGRRTDSFKDW